VGLVVDRLEQVVLVLVEFVGLVPVVRKLELLLQFLVLTVVVPAVDM
jgi:hypothetical protein